MPSLSNCDCIYKDDKELLADIVSDAVARRMELSKKKNRGEEGKKIDLQRIKKYDQFYDDIKVMPDC